MEGTAEETHCLAWRRGQVVLHDEICHQASCCQTEQDEEQAHRRSPPLPEPPIVATLSGDTCASRATSCRCIDDPQTAQRKAPERHSIESLHAWTGIRVPSVQQQHHLFSFE